MGIIDEVESKLIYLQVQERKEKSKVKIVSQEDLQQLRIAEHKIAKFVGNTIFKHFDTYYYWGMLNLGLFAYVVGAITYEIGVAEQSLTRLSTAISILEDAYVEVHNHLKKNTSHVNKAQRLLCYILLILGKEPPTALITSKVARIVK